MDCATEIRRIIQEIDRKTKTIFVNVTPARKCKLSSGITVNFHRREHPCATVGTGTVTSNYSQWNCTENSVTHTGSHNSIL